MGTEIALRGYLPKKSNKKLAEINKTKLTIVIPDYNLFSINYSPKTAWYSGCQFAALSFHIPGEFMKENFNFFDEA